ncbi:MAG: hypothetical protein KGN84_12030, partial [Acidobacteriota bacterium]|nr:hypothetical protein [Acidobacteriota bacterium]
GKFVMAIHRGKNFGEACQEAYGKSSSAVYSDLQKYFQRKKMYGRVFKAPLGKPASSLPVAPVDSFETKLVLADLLAALRRNDEAAALFRQLEAERPNRYEVPDSEGYMALAANDTAGARSSFERAFAANDPDPKMCFDLAMLERAAKQPPDKIVPPLERAVRLKPDYADAWLQLGLARFEVRQYDAGIAALSKIQKVGPDQATPVFASLAYGYLETGDLARAGKDAATAKQYARSPAEWKRMDALLELIAARAASPLAPKPGERTERVEGELRALECGPHGNRAAFSVGGRMMVFDLPDPKAVEFVHAGGTGALTLACGVQKPVWMAVEYAPASVVDRATLGVIRKLEY